MDTPPDWLDRLADTAERWNVRVQLLVGAILVGIIDYAMLSRIFQGLVTTPTWLALAIPIAATTLWLILAVWTVRAFLYH